MLGSIGSIASGLTPVERLAVERPSASCPALLLVVARRVALCDPGRMRRRVRLHVRLAHLYVRHAATSLKKLVDRFPHLFPAAQPPPPCPNEARQAVAVLDRHDEVLPRAARAVDEERLHVGLQGVEDRVVADEVLPGLELEQRLRGAHRTGVVGLHPLGLARPEEERHLHRDPKARPGRVVHHEVLELQPAVGHEPVVAPRHPRPAARRAACTPGTRTSARVRTGRAGGGDPRGSARRTGRSVRAPARAPRQPGGRAARASRLSRLLPAGPPWRSRHRRSAAAPAGVRDAGSSRQRPARRTSKLRLHPGQSTSPFPSVAPSSDPPQAGQRSRYAYRFSSSAMNRRSAPATRLTSVLRALSSGSPPTVSQSPRSVSDTSSCKSCGSDVPSASTRSTSGAIRRIASSIASFSVIVDDGQPLQLPLMRTCTTPASTSTKSTFPPCDSRYGRTLSSASRTRASTGTGCRSWTSSRYESSSSSARAPASTRSTIRRRPSPYMSRRACTNSVPVSSTSSRRLSTLAIRSSIRTSASGSS